MLEVSGIADRSGCPCQGRYAGRRHVLVAVLAVMFSHVPAYESAVAGVCLDSEYCSEPCPAANSCYWDADCDEGMICVPACLPSFCSCYQDRWTCTFDCAGECVPRPTWQGAPEYLIADLGTLGGPVSTGLSLSDSGYVVGGSHDREGNRVAYRWFAGTMIGLGSPPGLPISEAWGVNNQGDAVGIGVRYSGDSPRAMLWRNGEAIDLGDFGFGDAHAFGINDAGQVAGFAKVESTVHAFVWEDGVLRDLSDVLPGVGHGAYDIDPSGRVIGWDSTTDADGLHSTGFILEGDAITILAPLGGKIATARGLNEVGQAVGKSKVDPEGDWAGHAVLWDNGKVIDLGAIGGY